MSIVAMVLTAALASLPLGSAAAMSGAPPSQSSSGARALQSPSVARASQSPSAAEAIDELGRAVLASLKAGSFDGLADHVVSAEDMGELFAKALASGEITEEQHQEIAPQVPEMIEEAHASLLEDFERIHEKASWKEVSWDEAELAGFLITVRDPVSAEERTVDAATLDAEDAFVAEITLRFTAAGVEHELDLDNCACTNHGWVILERMNWFDS